MNLSNYTSVIKICGQPILPPVIDDRDRPALRAYREEAMKVEAQIAERARKAEEKSKRKGEEEARLAVEENARLEKEESVMSNMDTEQVMNFIRQALKDSSHLEEVQNLQQAIFDELQKYGASSPPMLKADSMDTLHNIDDFSTAADSSREVSPLKSFRSECSPPRIGEVLGRCNPNSLERLNSNPENLIGPCLNLSYPSTPPDAIFDPDFAGPSQEGLNEPRLVRRNSYTLESPSPSVLQYLKSLQIEDDEVSPEKTVKRNLNQLWSEALSTTGLDASATPENHSAKSWKSNSNHSNSSNDNPSIILNNSPGSKSNHSLLNQDQLNSNVSHTTNNSKNNCDDNRLPDYQKAAAKIQAGVRGYLTRRLLKTSRVVELKNAIRDSLITALQMHTEATVSKAEIELHRQLTMQIESLCVEWHQIFFHYTTQERMRIIQVDRMKAKNPKPKKPFLMRKSRSRVSMESSTNSLTQSTSSTASRPKSLPLVKPKHSSATSNFKTWK